jgi:hypothetical protein
MESTAPTSWKWTLVERDAVDLGFCLAQALKHCAGILFDRFGCGGFGDQIQDVFEMAMTLGFSSNDVKFGRGHPAAADLFHLELRSGIQALKDMHQCAAIGAGVD